MPAADQNEAIRANPPELKRLSAPVAPGPKNAAAVLIDSHVEDERLSRAISEVDSGEFDSQG